MTRSRSTTTQRGRPRRGHLLARNRDDFPAWRDHDLADLPSHLLATDGATSQTLLDKQLPRLKRSNLRPSVVTVTIGGNDVLGWYGGDTAGALQAAEAAVSRTDEALNRLRPLLAPKAQMAVGTVYDPAGEAQDPRHRRGRRGSCDWNV